ncbi:DUF3617 domain-containing protein [Acidithiobacillus concretivorus]|uniref:DUF3617 family protein n=1 Tax=Acidithiobacillus concretivorus TaxID=3063952 RepID=A0ABS5ZMW1_9PROT|nr:DUF3617 family protein [Acidithiobacillus concretivorus]MBU2737508.1 DUF3617 family protein [Acidithiobacillus concretivorus]
MRRLGIAILLLVGASSISALAADAPMQPGLWVMHVSGTTKVSSPPVSTPMERSMQICVKAHQKPESVFLPAGSDRCTGSHKVLPDGKTQWTFHCQAPGASMTQVGWFQTSPHHLNSHWVITAIVHSEAHYETVTDMQMQGTYLSAHCGKVK